MQSPIDGEPRIEEIRFCLSTFSLEGIKRAVYRFSGKFDVELSVVEGEAACRATPLASTTAGEVSDFPRSLRREVVDQDLRITVARETEPVRNLILSHTFSRTGLQENGQV